MQFAIFCEKNRGTQSIEQKNKENALSSSKTEEVSKTLPVIRNKRSMKNKHKNATPRTKPATAIPFIFLLSRLTSAKMIAKIAVTGEKHPQQRIKPPQVTIPRIMDVVDSGFLGAAAGGGAIGGI